MNKEFISKAQGISLMTLFIINGSIILPTAVEAQKDLWIAIILSMVLTIPMVVIYARLISIFPQKDLFDILQYVLGKFIGKGLSILYIWFAFHLGSIILRDFGEFIRVVALPETPQIIMILVPCFLCIFLLKLGLEVLGRLSGLFTIVIILSVICFGSLLIPILNINNIRPVLSNGIKPILLGAFSTFSFPFGETILLTTVFSSLEKKQSVYKVYILGLLLGGFTLLITNTFDVLVQGINTYSSMYFPGYVTISRVNIGDTIQRVEIVAALIFTLCTFVKLCVCMFVAVKGIAKIFNCINYKFIVIPIGLLSINLSYFIYDSSLELVEWSSKIWPYYAFPFQVILPILILITAEIKKKQGCLKR